VGPVVVVAAGAAGVEEHLMPLHHQLVLFVAAEESAE
jgi:hypothetical protein